jgi:hypothetical protein
MTRPSLRSTSTAISRDGILVLMLNVVSQVLHSTAMRFERRSSVMISPKSPTMRSIVVGSDAVICGQIWRSRRASASFTCCTEIDAVQGVERSRYRARRVTVSVLETNTSVGGYMHQFGWFLPYGCSWHSKQWKKSPNLNWWPFLAFFRSTATISENANLLCRHTEKGPSIAWKHLRRCSGCIACKPKAWMWATAAHAKITDPTSYPGILTVIVIVKMVSLSYIENFFGERPLNA